LEKIHRGLFKDHLHLLDVRMNLTAGYGCVAAVAAMDAAVFV
jgi:hypothetical protein